MTVAGGTPNYNYLWNTAPPQSSSTASNLPAGTYVVTVTDAHGCTTTAQATISQPPSSLTAGISSQTNVSCFGLNDGSATVTAAGGTPIYSYFWNTAPPQSSATASNLPAGTYVVTVTDAHGCTTTAQATITQPPASLTAAISSQTNVSCFGLNDGSATVTAAGGTPIYSRSEEHTSELQS